MNIAIIFAGGSGIRMNTKDIPKQFLLVHGKPIIVHTIEIFEHHPDIDYIIVSCIESGISYMQEMKYRYRLDKIRKIVPGGATGQMSIYNGLIAAKEEFGLDNNIVLIHDGVRPLIDDEIITKNIESVKKYNSAITCASAKETFVVVDDDNNIDGIPARKNSKIAKAPQSFWLKDILELEEKAIHDGQTNVIDSCTLAGQYGFNVSIVEGSSKNIKITTPEDFYIFRTLYDVKENRQLNDMV